MMPMYNIRRRRKSRQGKRKGKSIDLFFSDSFGLLFVCVLVEVEIIEIFNFQLDHIAWFVLSRRKQR
jgi:hypothetical protein